MGDRVRADHGRVWREESLQGLPAGGERMPSPGHPKQARYRHPLGTDSKSDEELAWDFLLNAARLPREAWLT